jgi:hypothetical protein
MVVTCGINGIKRKAHSVSGKTLKERDRLEDLGVNGGYYSSRPQIIGWKCVDWIHPAKDMVTEKITDH